MRYPRLSTATILGGIAWLLFVLFAGFQIYPLIASGQLTRSLYDFFSGGPSTNLGEMPVALLGMLIGPLAAAAAFIPICEEASGYSRTQTRRVASFIATVLLLVSAVSMVWYEHFFSGAIPPQGYTASSLRAGTILSSSYFASWALLFGVFAVARSPFHNTLTRVLAGLLAAEACLFAVVSLAGKWNHWSAAGFELSPIQLLWDAVEFSSWMLMIVFLLAALRENAAVRRGQA